MTLIKRLKRLTSSHLLRYLCTDWILEYIHITSNTCRLHRLTKYTSIQLSRTSGHQHSSASFIWPYFVCASSEFWYLDCIGLDVWSTVLTFGQGHFYNLPEYIYCLLRHARSGNSTPPCLPKTKPILRGKKRGDPSSSIDRIRDLLHTLRMLPLLPSLRLERY